MHAEKNDNTQKNLPTESEIFSKTRCPTRNTILKDQTPHINLGCIWTNLTSSNGSITNDKVTAIEK